MPATKTHATITPAERDDAERIERRKAFIAQLKQLREEAVQSGMPLLSWKEIEDQIARNRGEA